MPHSDQSWTIKLGHRLQYFQSQNATQWPKLNYLVGTTVYCSKSCKECIEMFFKCLVFFRNTAIPTHSVLFFNFIIYYIMWELLYYEKRPNEKNSMVQQFPLILFFFLFYYLLYYVGISVPCCSCISLLNHNMWELMYHAVLFFCISLFNHIMWELLYHVVLFL